MKIEIYSKEQCPYCTKALFLAEKVVRDSSQQNHVLNKYMLDKHFTREQLLEKVPSARTFPQIFIDGKSIGGYTEFKAYIGD
jgi:glutaredoxin